MSTAQADAADNTTVDDGDIREAARKYGYELTGRVGEGHTSILFSTVDKQGGKCALKVLKGEFDSVWLRRFQEEARILSRLDHPGLARLHPPGLLRLGRHYAFAMDYVNGVSLQKWVENSGPMDEKSALNFVISISDTLEYVHRSGVVHRDLHAGNVMLVDGKLGEYKVVDFGTARDHSIEALQGAAAYRTFRPIGAMSHCAPEQWIAPHSVGPAADVFSVGVLLYRAVTKEYPFWDNNSYIQLYSLIQRGEHVPIQKRRADISHEFGLLIAKMLEPSVLLRISSFDKVKRVAKLIRDGVPKLAPTGVSAPRSSFSVFANQTAKA